MHRLMLPLLAAPNPAGVDGHTPRSPEGHQDSFQTSWPCMHPTPICDDGGPPPHGSPSSTPYHNAPHLRVEGFRTRLQAIKEEENDSAFTKTPRMKRMHFFMLHVAVAPAGPIPTRPFYRFCYASVHPRRLLTILGRPLPPRAIDGFKRSCTASCKLRF